MFKYMGAGEFIPGVPARDLSDEEAEEYDVTDHPLYKRQSKRVAEIIDDAGTEREDGKPLE